MEINISIVQMGYDRETYFFKKHYLADCLVHGYFTICLKNLLSICYVKDYLQVAYSTERQITKLEIAI